MRPQGRGELESLYFDYPHFEPPQRRDGLSTAAPVVIVGAGPVGMVAALTLAKQGVASVLVERKATFNDGSRAICVARQSFHILAQLGAVDPFLEKALGWTLGRSFYRGQQILEFGMPDGPEQKFRPMYNIQQQFIEAYLYRAVAAQPLIDMRWQTEVTGITLGAKGATLQLTDPLGSYALPCAWVLAADGARSTIRQRLGLRLRGTNFEGRYVIADVKMAHDYPTIRRALFDPACRPGGTVLIHRQPDDLWRIDYQLRPDEATEAAIEESAVRAAVAGVLAEIGHHGPWELEWWSIYTANTLLLDDYRHGCVFFIGDSAHIVPIFGVRGLNNGLADGHNIGWKLAHVLTGRADPRILDSYTPERRGATLDVFANAIPATRFMTPPGPGWRIMRDAALSLALDYPWAGQLANPRQMTPYRYVEGGLVQLDDHQMPGPLPGAAMPDAAVGDGHLADLWRADWQVIATAPVPGLAAVVVPGLFGAAPGAGWLVRPDLHIAARWPQVTAAAVAATMAQMGVR